MNGEDGTSDERPYAGEERRSGVALRYITPEELADWRAGTLRLTEEVASLAETLKGLASMEDVERSKKVTLRRVYLVAGAVVLVLIALVGGAVATAAVFQGQQADFREAIADSCEIRNDADQQRREQSTVAFTALLKSLDDDNLREALEKFATSSPPPPVPDCDRLREH